MVLVNVSEAMFVKVNSNSTPLVYQDPNPFLGGRNLHLQDDIVSSCKHRPFLLDDKLARRDLSGTSCIRRTLDLQVVCDRRHKL